MSGETALLSQSWPVGTFTVTMSIRRPIPGTASSVVIEWAPHEPSRLSGHEVAEYRAGRAAAVAELSRLLGRRIVVAEI